VDPDAGDLLFLARTVRRGGDELQRAIASAEASGPPRGGQLCAYLKSALEAINARTKILRDDANAATNEERRAIAQELRLLNAAVRALHGSTPWLESLKEPFLSLGLIYFLDDACEDLLHVRSDLVLTPDARYMYSTFGLAQVFETLLAKLDAEPPKGSAPIVINYPRLERDSLLLHPVFIHELSHDAVGRHNLRDRIFAQYDNLDALDQQFTQAVAALVQFQENSTETAISEEEAAVMLRGLLNGWLDELLCDQLALTYLGPSYLLAATAFLLPVGRKQPSATHPPASLRLSLMLRFLQAMEWRPEVDERIPSIARWLDSIANQGPQTEQADYLQFVHSAVAMLANPMRQVASDHLGKAVLTPDDYKSQSQELGALLRHGVLPAQLEGGAPADRRAVLIAAWFHALERSGDEPLSITAALEDTESQRFFAKALEMSFILEEWRTP
jgi:hypothetical protein